MSQLVKQTRFIGFAKRIGNILLLFKKITLKRRKKSQCTSIFIDNPVLDRISWSSKYLIIKIKYVKVINPFFSFNEHFLNIL